MMNAVVFVDLKCALMLKQGTIFSGIYFEIGSCATLVKLEGFVGVIFIIKLEEQG